MSIPHPIYTHLHLKAFRLPLRLRALPLTSDPPRPLTPPPPSSPEPTAQVESCCVSDRCRRDTSGTSCLSVRAGRVRDEARGGGAGQILWVGGAHGREGQSSRRSSPRALRVVGFKKEKKKTRQRFASELGAGCRFEVGGVFTCEW